MRASPIVVQCLYRAILKMWHIFHMVCAKFYVCMMWPQMYYSPCALHPATGREISCGQGPTFYDAQIRLAFTVHGKECNRGQSLSDKLFCWYGRIRRAGFFPLFFCFQTGLRFRLYRTVHTSLSLSSISLLQEACSGMCTCGGILGESSPHGAF